MNSRNCPTCSSPLAKAATISGNPSTFWLECTRCNTLINTYKPQHHQMSTHLDSTLYLMNAGGYGSGKTLTSQQEIYRHLFITPNANVLVGAKITPQYEQTIKRDIENDLPSLLIKQVNVQKSYIDLVNNSRIMFRPLDQPDKLRSLNLSMFVIVEASEVPAEAFHQLKTRLRNQAAFTTTHDWRRGIVETNPGAGWIRTDFLMNAHQVVTYGSNFEQYAPALEPDPNMSVHITSTDANTYLPPTFISELSANKPAWWTRKFIYGSFQYAEGLVYPSATKHVIPEFPVPKHWKRVVACDYGLSDKFAYVAAAIDPLSGIVYVYRNTATNEKNIKELATIYYDFTSDIPQGLLYTAPILDPKSGSKRDYNKKTLFDHFLDYGIYFKAGHIQIDARVFRVNTYLESGRLKIMDNCTELIKEISEYKFPERNLNDKIHSDKPIDKNNHSINPLEWICMELPSNPNQLSLASFNANDFDDPETLRRRRILNNSWQLSDNDNENDDLHRTQPFTF